MPANTNKKRVSKEWLIFLASICPGTLFMLFVCIDEDWRPQPFWAWTLLPFGPYALVLFFRSVNGSIRNVRAEQQQDSDSGSERAEEKQGEQRQESESRKETDSPPIKDEKYYGRILGLRGAVTFEDVKRRYRELVVQYHPDKVNHLGPKLKQLAEEEMKEINAAYAYFKERYGNG